MYLAKKNSTLQYTWPDSGDIVEVRCEEDGLWYQAGVFLSGKIWFTNEAVFFLVSTFPSNTIFFESKKSTEMGMKQLLLLMMILLLLLFFVERYLPSLQLSL